MNGVNAAGPLLLIAGIPAVGKSTFGRWLAKERGYLHIDPEEDSRLKSPALSAAWQLCHIRLRCESFVTELKKLECPVVFNWGFPPRLLPAVDALKHSGFVIWWFDAEVGLARQSFINRGGELKTIADFDKQVADINAAKARILPVFEPNVLVTLDATGHVPPDELWRRMNAMSEN